MPDGCSHEEEAALYVLGGLTAAERLLVMADHVFETGTARKLLQQRIALRARDYERTINQAYLERLNGLYENWISGFTLCPVLTVPADELDYVAHPRHLELVANKVQEKLTGKDVVVFSVNEVTQAND